MIFRDLRNFQYIKSSTQINSSTENIRKELDKFTNKTKIKVNNFKERLILIYLDLFNDPEQSNSLHLLSNQKIIKFQQYFKNVYPELQMYVLFELKKIIIDNDEKTLKFFQENNGWKVLFSDYFIRTKINHLNKNEMNTNLQTLLLNFTFSTISKYQNYFDYQILSNQFIQNNTIISNLTLLNKFLEMNLEIIKFNRQISANKFISYFPFETVKNIIFKIDNKNKKGKEIDQTIKLYLNFLDQLFQNGSIETIYEIPQIINFLFEPTLFSFIQEIALTHIPIFFEKTKNFLNKVNFLFLIYFNN
ncbi:hypothetical protein M0811_06187 [Anaeramoeba ignava]|uniref:Uncharacterized protein n=1 Tax=Anaeramoeba ignava TaxID=1746090 RepID=A0A9Q0LPC5_ANAIG|nr:hypothetical protein M0811_06187 [Anaeramoeba ignava]